MKQEKEYYLPEATELKKEDKLLPQLFNLLKTSDDKPRDLEDI